MDGTSTTLQVIVCIHFMLSAWGSMGHYMPMTYLYVNGGVVVCGLWAIAQSQSTEAVIMTLVTLLFSVIEDIILLGLYEPRGYDLFEKDEKISASLRNEYRFALGMAITNLILKPLSAYLLYRVYQARTREEIFSIPGINRLPGFGDGRRRGYSDIDRNADSAPHNTGTSEKDTAQGNVDKA